MNGLSAICLAILSVVCLMGIFAASFKDNWLQFFGLCGISVWSIAQFIQVVDGRWVSPQQLMVHVSLAVFAAGSALKVVKTQKPTLFSRRSKS